MTSKNSSGDTRAKDIVSEKLETGTGLESERAEDDSGVIDSPFDPSEIDVITQSRTIGLLMERLEYDEMDLAPDFQRRANLWKDSQKSGLIESILLRIPIPSLYVSEDEEGNYQVVDGLQRICAIAHFVKVSILNKNLDTKLAPLRLTKLPSLEKLNGESFEDLPRPLQRRINETELTLHIIRAGTPANVKFNIFSRINQTGLPLKAQEIRNAIYPGKWRKHIREMAESKEFLRATEGKIKGERLEDYELILRFVALFSLGPKKARASDENLDDFLNNFVSKVAPSWDKRDWDDVKYSFNVAMKYAPKLFGRHAFRKYDGYGNRKPINRGLFETQSVAIAWRSEKELKSLGEESEQILEQFSETLNANWSFQNALLYATGRGSSSNRRIVVLNSIFDRILDA